MKIEIVIITFIGITTIVGMLSILYDLVFNTNEKQVVYICKQKCSVPHEYQEDLFYDNLLDDINYDD